MNTKLNRTPDMSADHDSLYDLPSDSSSKAPYIGIEEELNWIHKATGYPLEVIDVILDAEMDFLTVKGIVSDVAQED